MGPFLNTRLFLRRERICWPRSGRAGCLDRDADGSPLRGLGYFTAFASFGTPFILYTIGWLLILGKAGPVNIGCAYIFAHSGPVR